MKLTIKTTRPTAPLATAGTRIGMLGGWAFVLLAMLVIVRGSTMPAMAEPLKVCVTTGMVADLVKQVGGRRIFVTQLMGPGVDPHLYKPTAADAAALGKADLVFYSGLMLEGRMGDLFASSGRSGKRVYAVTGSLPKDRLLEPAGFAGHSDPHVWLDVSLWAQGVPIIVKALSEADPEGAPSYESAGKDLQARLGALHAWCLCVAGELAPDRRVLVTSHDAFNYFGRAYGFKVIGLQGVSTVSEAGLADMSSLIALVRRQRIKAVFVESSVNPQAIGRVSQEAPVKIGGELFSDAMGEQGEMRGGNDTGTYEGMIRYNMRTIVDALK
jgi:manganese/zinc/iron transport system substrate-binding protein